MFETEVREKIEEKIEYDIYLLKEYISIYLKLFSSFPGNKEFRNKFTNFIKEYYLYSWLEYQILVRIKNTNYHENLEQVCVNMLEELDSIFLKQFNYNEYILSSYEDAISMKEINRAVIPKKEFETITKENNDNFIKKLNLK